MPLEPFDRNHARLFLESLVERVVIDASTGRPHLPGALSAHEIQALHAALEALGGTAPPASGAPSTDLASDALAAPPAVAAPHAAPAARPQEPTADLNLDSLRSEGPEDPEVLLCLDFGTAMSKAFASVIQDGHSIEHLGLRIGTRAKPGPLIYPVPSSLWVADDGKIYVGPQAHSLSEHQDPSGLRPRFDSLKRELTLGDTTWSPSHVPLNEKENPSGVRLTKGDAITLYLSYLTDLACTELVEAHGRSRYVSRRFALPSWSPDRREWGERMLADMLSRAQIVADTFHGRWDAGIPASEARAVLDAVDALTRKPTHLLAEGVPEPLAAGASHLRRDESARGLAMVVDVGAGTSDFALFVVAENPEREIFRAWPLQRCSTALQMAGDHLDNALRKVILESAHVDSRDPEAAHINLLLSRQIRFLKEQLFTDGECVFTLINGARGRVVREEFLQRPEVERFGQELAKTFAEVLEHVDSSVFERLHPGGLTVVLTGGGATLPMVQDLARGASHAHGFSLQRRGTPLVPEAFSGDEELRAAYPQLAVAIGGSQPDMIGEGDAIAKMPGLSDRAWTIERFQVSGT